MLEARVRVFIKIMVQMLQRCGARPLKWTRWKNALIMSRLAGAGQGVSASHVMEVMVSVIFMEGNSKWLLVLVVYKIQGRPR